MISKLTTPLAAFCVATVITQVILTGYFASRGALTAESMTKLLALMNGIDITGNKLQQILRESEDRRAARL